MKKKPDVGSLFPSDHIPKAKKDVGVHFFIHSCISCKLYQLIPGTF